MKSATEDVGEGVRHLVGFCYVNGPLKLNGGFAPTVINRVLIGNFGINKDNRWNSTLIRRSDINNDRTQPRLTGHSENGVIIWTSIYRRA